MDERLRAWLERTGVTRAEAPGLLVAALGAVVALVVAMRVPLGDAVLGPTRDPVAPAPVVTPAPAADGEGAVAPGPGPSSDPAEVVVHVSGAVASPGVVALPPAARVADAIAAAGGSADDAAVDALNLARVLVDGERIHVPTTSEAAAAPPGTLDGTGPGGTATPGPPAGRLPDGRVDLDTADAATLEELPGVGPVLAGRIVAFRDEIGRFEESAQLREVSGIGEATWAGLRDLVGVAGEPTPATADP